MGDSKEAEALGAEWKKDDPVIESGRDEGERETWSGKLDFVMSALSFAVGMGNMWRFPYLVYKNGGGAFLIPYVFMMVFTGFPLMFLELAFGQWGRLGIVSIWRKACPLYEGIGWGMFVVSLVTSVYYNMLNAWAVFYIAASFAKDVPWRTCGNSWNTDKCGEAHLIVAQNNCTKFNGTWYNMTCYNEETTEPEVLEQVQHLANLTGNVTIKSPSDEYFHNYMLDISDGIQHPGHVRWPLALCLLFMWVIVFVCLSKGIKSSGKATYVTALFPYFVLIILFVRGITLEGAREGILYYLTPEWKRLGSATVWKDAAVQVFFSLSTCWGGLITLASYNKRDNNCFRDSIIVSAGDCLTSIFGGVVIFSFIGYMAHVLQSPIDSVATQGAGLAYIVYPEAVTTLPLSQLWAVLFMLMLINVGVGTQFTLVSTVQTCLMDVHPQTLRGGYRPTLLLLVQCVVLYIIGLAICSQGGMYVLQLMDNYSATYGLLTIGLFLCLSLGWSYGTRQLADNVETMFGYRPGWFFAACWRVITPGILIFILLFTLIDFKRSSYGGEVFPIWTDVIGWIIPLVEILIIPFFIVYKLCTTEEEGTLMEKLRFLTRTQPGWGGHKTTEHNIPLTTGMKATTA